MGSISESFPAAPVYERVTLPSIVRVRPPDYSLVRRDKLNLRTTSKGLDKWLMRWFVKILSFGLVKKTNLVEFFMTAEDIRALHAVSNSGTIGEAIKFLHINVGHFETKKGALSLHSPLRGELDEYKDVFLTGDGAKLLSQAFSNLPNLQEVYIGKGRMPFHKHQTDHCAWEERREFCVDPRVPGNGYILRTEAVKRVLEALAISGQRIKKLVIESGSSEAKRDEAGLWSFDLPKPIFAKLTTSFQNLTRLHLTMSFARDELAHPHTKVAGSTEDERLQWLVQFLLVASSIESFHLAASQEGFFSSDFIDAVRDALPDCLKEFHLHNSMLTATALRQVLALHQRNVTELGLYNCILVDENWEPFFHLLDVFKPRLKHVYLEELWELRPDPETDLSRLMLSPGVKRWSGRHFAHDKAETNTCTVSACIDRQPRHDFRDNAMFIYDGEAYVTDIDLKVHTVDLFYRGFKRKLEKWM